MLFSNDRNKLRQIFFTTWQQHQTHQPLEPLAQQVLQVILEHPEYCPILDNPEQFIDKDYLPDFGESNPFLHMSLHLSIREQLATNRPAGIINVYQTLLAQANGNHLAVEHRMIEILMEHLWLAQRYNHMPDEQQYLVQLQQLCEVSS